MKKITVLGGGTGTYVVLSGLKSYPVDLSAIVTMMDSGGSTGKLRDQLGVLPPGDLRQCLIALSEASLLWRKLFLYRFEKGDLAGHNFGNIFLSALEKVSHDYNEVIKTASYILNVKGKVVPVTFKKAHLVVDYENGKTLKGEGNIDTNEQETSKIKTAFLEPEIEANPEAITTIANSDLVVVGPGDLYTSIISVLLVKGIKEALTKTKAKIIYVLNLMTKSGQTNDYSASNHLLDLKKYLRRGPDIVLINNGRVPSSIISWYHAHNETEVINDLKKENFSGRIFIDDLIQGNFYLKNKADKLTRSILRHDSKKLAKTILKFI
ncbi:hypothetical protein COS31_02850 [Candidatus Roizmanbacteria bacterium CG02_land_8_20_14_3_00_36_15]|uniref:Putative gluconeogenesis factor n=2 Tax=Candidatus Roizmaniibacteriota TaxID=1752723 RepID=A0A2M8KM92_9BACT|nr:MAG: hypothetical protein COS51_01320 [Candidatus Roizmanbacteria bacterium CG03_land_8_20_14_0_80_36_21]PIV37787.1 MAG: hypothetical protein COS31_02850 [Candidatus Roizmanbacteria bacterium CG02_land_8_20_14_3_00_36_15]PIY70013.1 MAG: hypothetical protein COY89_03375 [Candidatus Roizmanbacteria bacterium CG_4_10_14_0_8_um_filter_36_36]PJA52881.1 MAG: hypothetical protein CO166_03865 [Candidatus Roizmanbacteria bacterium CG_4_9_14_3_um_filter_36_11]PJC81627.1 MAG: hypothetical protein CO007